MSAVAETEAMSGRLVAVCGLAGGAGTTSLAALLASQAASEAERPVLLADLGGPGATLATYIGQGSPRTLLGAAEALALGRLGGSLFATLGPRLRLLAGEPDFDCEGSEGLVELLAQAREVHELTVIDCGTLQRPAEREVLGLASHVLWLATPEAVASGRAEAGLRAAAALAPQRGVLAIRGRAGRLRARARPWAELAERFSLALAPLAELPLPLRLCEHVPVEAVGSLRAIRIGLR